MIDTNEKSFRTSNDETRTQRAAGVVAKHLERAARTEAEVDAAEAACADDPSDKNFTRAKAARREHEDAARDLALARAHAAKVETEIATAERARIADEIARREACLTEVVDDSDRETAIEIATLAARLRGRMVAQLHQRRADLESLNQLRARLGVPVQEVPGADRLVTDALRDLADLGLAAQQELGAPIRELAGTFGAALPFWRRDGAPWGAREFNPGEVDGVRDGDAIRAAAVKLLARVQSRAAAPEKAARTGAGLAAAAVVAALAVVAATNLAGG